MPTRRQADEVLEFLRLVWEVNHGLQRASKRMTKDLGVTGPQRLALRMIHREPAMPTLRLASLLHLHPSTVTGILDRLQQAGLVARVSDPADARRSRLRLTARGQALNRVDRGTVESAVGAALERLSPATIAAGRELLRALSAALDPDGSPRARPASRQRARRS